MLAIELNQRHRQFIEEGFDGVESNFDPISKYLDRLLRILIHCHPGFKLKQIKMKFGEVCFYSNLHELYNDDDRQRDHNVSLKIQAKLEKQLMKY
ncbi:hypothetical protein EHQ43_17520 [Leptospira bouyouniensis]|uniref:Uncharacterized protein n=1 Tax=Leptospira bouyouniensis TaxID=2484911 RepID=A0A7I0HPD4_9LEPT|nr:hypothetical protein [Leptospira bouyouniensis]TGL03552.1 hypothetical protein EHQ43_17520 [Leptospira bouyouniensis]